MQEWPQLLKEATDVALKWDHVANGGKGHRLVPLRGRLQSPRESFASVICINSSHRLCLHSHNCEFIDLWKYPNQALGSGSHGDESGGRKEHFHFYSLNSCLVGLVSYNKHLHNKRKSILLPTFKWGITGIYSTSRAFHGEHACYFHATLNHMQLLADRK